MNKKLTSLEKRRITLFKKKHSSKDIKIIIKNLSGIGSNIIIEDEYGNIEDITDVSCW